MLDICASYRIAVIGAGVAGGVCASRLRRLPGVATTVYDMGSRGPGGRASSRPVDGRGGSFSPADCGGASGLVVADLAPLAFDHGVQAFAVTNEDVRALLTEWIDAGHVQEWAAHFGTLDASTGRFGPEAKSAVGYDESAAFTHLIGRAKYVGFPRMSDLVRGMLELSKGSALTTLTNTKALKIEHASEGEDESGSRWKVESSDGATRHFDAVVISGHAASLAADVADSLTPVMTAQEREASAHLCEQMRRVSYPAGASPLYALMVAFQTPLDEAAAPFDGANVVGSEDVRWMSKDSSKPGRAREDGLELWVVLSTEAFARRVEHSLGGAAPDAQGGERPTERGLQMVASELLEAMASALHAELPPIVYAHAQRWQAGLTRRALDLGPSPCAAWPRHGLAACGDWAAAHASVEEVVAARSGLAAASVVGEVYRAAAHMRTLLSKEIPPGDVDALAARALVEWPEWTCEAFPHSSSGRFRESRWWEAAGREGAVAERCLVTSGRALLWPEGGGPPIEIAAGEWVTFSKGFQCTWVVHEAIAKRYVYLDEDGKEL